MQWDTRQKVENPLVVLRNETSTEARHELAKLTSDVIEEGKDFSTWGGLVAEVLAHPSKTLKIVGFVGTNGKTTTVALTRFLLVQAGLKVFGNWNFGGSALGTP